MSFRPLLVVRLPRDNLLAARGSHMFKPNVLAAAAFVFGCFVVSADAQTSPTTVRDQKAVAAPAPPTAAAKREERKQLRAARKAQRSTIRQKRAQCFDQGKKKSLTGQPLIDFIRTCTAA